MKNVLMLLYFFPPSVGPAIQRGLKFCKYMNRFGYRPTVISAIPSRREVVDPALEHDLCDADYGIYRVRKLDLAGLAYQHRTRSYNRTFLKLFVWAKVFIRNMLIPDKAIVWGIFALRKAMLELKCTSYEVLCSSFFPGTAHWVALRIKRRYPTVKWVADFRDSWMSDPTVKRRFINRVINRPLERRVLRICDHAVFVNDSIRSKYVRKHPHLAHKSSVVSNGFDFADLAMLPPDTTTDRPRERTIVIHAGTLSQTRTPDALLRAITQHNAAKPSGPRFKFISVGAFYSDLPESTIHEMVEADYLEIVPFVPKQELYTYYGKADIIAVIVNQSKGAEEIQTGKLFEAISLSKRVLLLGPIPGEAERVLRRTRAGIAVGPGSTVAVVDALEALTRGQALQPDQEAIASYSSERNTEKLCALFDRLTN